MSKYKDFINNIRHGHKRLEDDGMYSIDGLKTIRPNLRRERTPLPPGSECRPAEKVLEVP